MLLPQLAVQSLHGHTVQLQHFPRFRALFRQRANPRCNRRTTQKPPAELYENFKSKFSGLGPNVSAADISQVAPGATALSNDAPAGISGYALRPLRCQSVYCCASCVEEHTYCRALANNLSGLPLAPFNRRMQRS